MTGEADPRPGFEIRPELNGMTEDALGSLTFSNAGLYVRSRMLVTVATSSVSDERWRKRPVDAPVIKPVSEPRLLSLIDAASRWEKYDSRSKTWRQALPPACLSTQILARTEWPFPPLVGLIGTPTLRADGSVLDTPGYDTATGLYLVPPTGEAPWPGVSDSPSRADVVDAVEKLLHPVADFPFVSDSDRATYVAAVLTLAVRNVIEGPVPMFPVRAPAPGTGKTILTEIVGIIGNGRVPDMITADDPDELRKRVTTMVLDGTAAVVLDNASGALGSDLLAGILTRTTWEDRLLGTSQQVSAPLRIVWFATGNNLGFKKTLARRVLPIDLDAHLENPEDRTGFRYADVRAHVREHRLAYVAAALTVVRAFHLAGRPHHGRSRMGSFEAWDDVVRAAVVWSGLPDFGATSDPESGRSRIRRDADHDVEALADLLTLLDRLFPDGREFTSADVSARVDSEPALRHALLALPGARASNTTAAGVPYVLRDITRRPAGGLQLNDSRPAKRPRRYYIAGHDKAERYDRGTIVPLFAGVNGSEVVTDRGEATGGNRSTSSHRNGQPTYGEVALMRFVAVAPDPCTGRLTAYLDAAGQPIEFQADNQDEANQKAKAMRLPPAVYVLADELRTATASPCKSGARQQWSKQSTGHRSGGVLPSGSPRRAASAVGGGRRRSPSAQPNESQKPNDHNPLSRKGLGPPDAFQRPQVRTGPNTVRNDASENSVSDWDS